MPEMDGFEATAAIREMEKQTGGYTPVIAMTAHAMGGYKERCLEAGMDGYVTKPIQRELLLRTLEELRGGTRPGPAAGGGLDGKPGQAGGGSVGVHSQNRQCADHSLWQTARPTPPPESPA
jgi:DNA-binding response OmpR family regulator